MQDRPSASSSSTSSAAASDSSEVAAREYPTQDELIEKLSKLTALRDDYQCLIIEAGGGRAHSRIMNQYEETCREITALEQLISERAMDARVVGVENQCALNEDEIAKQSVDADASEVKEEAKAAGAGRGSNLMQDRRLIKIDEADTADEILNLIDEEVTAMQAEDEDRGHIELFSEIVEGRSLIAAVVERAFLLDVDEGVYLLSQINEKYDNYLHEIAFDAQNADGDTLFHIAASAYSSSGHDELFEELLPEVMDVVIDDLIFEQNKSGITPFFKACDGEEDEGKSDLLKYFLCKMKFVPKEFVDIDTQDISLYRVLESYDDVEDESRSKELDKQYNDGKTPLQSAAKNNNSQSISLLIAAGASKKHHKQLLEIAKHTNAKCAQLLKSIFGGIEYISEARDELPSGTIYNNLLELSVVVINADLFEFLCDQADALESFSEKQLDNLLSENMRLLLEGYEDDGSALVILKRLLIKNGVNIEQYVEGGMNPFHICAADGWIDSLILLLKMLFVREEEHTFRIDEDTFEDDIDSVDIFQISSTDELATIVDNRNQIKERKGFKGFSQVINLKDPESRTALSLAVKYRSLHALKLLLAAGAEIDEVTLNLAEESKEIKAFLYAIKILENEEDDDSELLDLVQNKDDCCIDLFRMLWELDSEWLIKFIKNIKDEDTGKNIIHIIAEEHFGELLEAFFKYRNDTFLSVLKRLSKVPRPHERDYDAEEYEDNWEDKSQVAAISAQTKKIQKEIIINDTVYRLLICAHVLFNLTEQAVGNSRGVQATFPDEIIKIILAFSSHKVLSKKNLIGRIVKHAKLVSDEKDKEKCLKVIFGDIEEQLKTQSEKYGYSCHRVGNYGNCFFHVIAHQLDLLGHRYTHEQLLHSTAQHLIDNIRDYHEFSKKGMDEIIREIAQPSNQRTQDLCIRALSRAMNITVVIIRSDSNRPDILRRANPKCRVYLGYEVGFHYQSLVPNSKSSEEKATENIEAIIQQAPIDPGVKARLGQKDRALNKKPQIERGEKKDDNGSKNNKLDLATWYFEDDINRLLERLLPPNVIRVAQTPLGQRELLEDNLRNAIEQVRIQRQPAVIPIHLHGNHWAGLVIKLKSDGILQVIYNDPKGHLLNREPQTMDIVQSITRIDNKAEIIDLSLRQQQNDNDCGPFTVDNLVQLATSETEGKNQEALRLLLSQPKDGSANTLRLQQHNFLTQNPANWSAVAGSSAPASSRYLASQGLGQTMDTLSDTVIPVFSLLSVGGGSSSASASSLYAQSGSTMFSTGGASSLSSGLLRPTIHDDSVLLPVEGGGLTTKLKHLEEQKPHLKI